MVMLDNPEVPCRDQRRPINHKTNEMQTIPLSCSFLSTLWSLVQLRHTWHVIMQPNVEGSPRDILPNTQKDSILSQYYARLSSLWREIDLHNALDLKYANDSMSVHKWVEKIRVYDFLAALAK